MGPGNNFRAQRTFTKRRISISEKKEEKPKAPTDFSHIGGNKVGHPAPEKAEKPIDFRSIGGKCVLKAGDHPLFNAKPETVETEDDPRE